MVTRSAICSLLLLLCFTVSVSAQDSLNVRLIGQINPMENALGVEVVGTLAYVAAGASGLRLVDISDPETPVEIGAHDTPVSAYDVAVAGTHVFVADYFGGLRVVDTVNPESPTEIGFLNTVGPVLEVEIQGNHAYLANRDYGLRIVDISNVSQPQEVGAYDTVYAYGLSISGDYAYLAGGGALRIVDISNPAEPYEASHYDLLNAYGVDVADHYVYVVAQGGLRVFDVTDPDSPEAIGFGGGGSEDVTVHGDYAYVAGWVRDLTVLDVTDPSQPMETGFYDATDGGALSVAVMGDYAYVANNVFFGIYDCSGALSMSERVPELMPRTVTLHSCYPNPFNPHTTISFDLPSASPVLLEVFNLTGQRVTILLDTRMTAGTHNLTFDGSHLASGAYFYSLTAGDYTATQKMLLIK